MTVARAGRSGSCSTVSRSGVVEVTLRRPCGWRWGWGAMPPEKEDAAGSPAASLVPIDGLCRPGRCLLLLVRQRFEVLVDEIPEFGRRLFAAGQIQVVTVAVDFSTEPVLEPLQAFENE